MRVTAVIGLIGAGLLLAGCGSGTVSGDADAEGTAAGEPVFSPCDDIPGEVVGALGVDPATEERDILGVKQPGWNVCGWRGSEYSVSIFATTRTLDEVRTNDRNEDVLPVELDVAGHDVVDIRCSGLPRAPDRCPFTTTTVDSILSPGIDLP
ncbi:DUF3558 domain-containing protein [Rhodococcus hoagii]|nr:DUF3558 domain-containing protein [Prescottella equi]